MKSTISILILTAVFLGLALSLGQNSVDARGETCAEWSEWYGIAIESDGDRDIWGVRLTVDDVAVGQVSGTSFYLGSDCVGELVRLEDNEGQRAFSETFTNGGGACGVGGRIELIGYVNPDVPGACELMANWYLSSDEPWAGALLYQTVQEVGYAIENGPY